MKKPVEAQAALTFTGVFVSLKISLSSVPLGAYGERGVPGEPVGGGIEGKVRKEWIAHLKSSPLCAGQVSAHWSSFPSGGCA